MKPLIFKGGKVTRDYQSGIKIAKASVVIKDN